LWELRDGPAGFNDLQARCDGMSPSSLSQRLGELAEAGLVEERDGARALTADGRSLGHAFAPLYAWAERHGQRVR
jgi:DNA-binding HxlR family transcriptional regulator